MTDLFKLHFESMAMCFVLILFLLLMELNTRQGMTWRKYLPSIYVFVMILLVIDTVWYMIDGNPKFIVLHKIIQTIYLIIYPLLGWVWFTFCAETFKKINIINKKWLLILKYGTLALNTILVLLSWKFGFVYIVNEQGTYIRGPLIMFTNGIMYSTMISAAILSVIEGHLTTVVSEKKHYYSLGYYTIPVLVMGLAQLLSPPGVTSAYFGFVITFALILIDSLKLQITQDSLTGLYNQSRINRMIQDRISKYKEGDVIVLGIYDLDKFKKINDTYGHSEGDDALRNAALSIGSVCRKYDVAASRIHGDEFVVLIDGEDVENPEAVLKEIADTVYADSESKPYRLELSYGSATYAPGMTFKTFFDIADNNLYAQKRSK